MTLTTLHVLRVYNAHKIHYQALLLEQPHIQFCKTLESPQPACCQMMTQQSYSNTIAKLGSSDSIDQIRDTAGGL